MISRLAAGREQEVVEIVLVGNTVMHHLFSGLDVEPLSHVPFQSPHTGAQHFRPEDLDWPVPRTAAFALNVVWAASWDRIFLRDLAVGMKRLRRFAGSGRPGHER